IKHPFKYPLLWLVLAWALVAAVIFLSLTHHPIQVPGPQGDKYGHIAAYAAMMFWFMQIYEDRPSRVLVPLGLVALGLSLAFVQGWVGYRTFDHGDMIADAAGVIVGWFLGPPRTGNVLDRVDRSM